jgi:hypothetical protein
VFYTYTVSISILYVTLKIKVYSNNILLMEYRTISLEKLKNEIKSFDIIYTTCDTYFSRLINIVQKYVNGTRGVHSHIAICVKGDVFPDDSVFESCDETKHKIDKNKLYLLESDRNTTDITPTIFGNFEDGFQIREFDNSIEKYLMLNKTYSYVSCSRLVTEHQDTLEEYFKNEDNKKIFREYIQSHIHFKYNGNILDQMTRIFGHVYILTLFEKILKYINGDEKSINCIEMVCNILKHVNVLDENIDSKLILPEDLLPKGDYMSYRHNDVNKTYNDPFLIN